MTAAAVVTLPRLPALVEGSVHHRRTTPVHHEFSYRQLQWLVDLDDLPDWGVLARFRACDHLDAPAPETNIRGGVRRVLAEHGVTLEAQDRVVMLAHPRSFGHGFNPLTVFWCLRPDGTVRAVVFEVHNTYGGRHPYVFDGITGQVDKKFYVSPFNDLEGHYEMRTELTPERVEVRVALVKGGREVFSAATQGTVQPATRVSVLAQTARHALMTWRVSALIRYQGVKLWARRLPIHPREEHP